MQIKTITCHDVYNHGASLQAYALQTYLSNLGHDVEIIDYKPDYLSGHYSLWSVDNSIYDKPIVKQLYLLAKLPGRLIALRRKKAFDEFTRQYLHLTTKRYHNNEELKANPPEADVYIAGSDQIWNTLFLNGRDAAFYLDFAPKSAKRISYAASFATDNIAEDYKPFVKRMLQNFDAVSIRERNSLELLYSLGRKNGVSVCDPVFLLSKQKWNQILPEVRINEEYLLVYDTEGSVALRDIAVSIAKKKKWKIFNVSASHLSYCDKDYWWVDPLSFIRLIRDACYVVSNSFHASAFSIIFERNFCLVNRSENINERMVSLLDEFGLSNRMSDLYCEELNQQIDYSHVVQRRENIVSRSKAFLNEHLT